MTLIQSRRGVGFQKPAWQYWMKRLLPQIKLTPLRIAFLYTMFGGIALFISDVLFVRYFSEPLLSQVQALKGGVEVMLTAGLIFLLTARQETQLQRSEDRIKQQREELQVLHRVLRHNLRNELNVIRGYADLIRDQLTADALDEECSKILETVDELIQHTEQAKRIKQITEPNGKVHTHELPEMIPQLVDDHPRVTSDIDVSTDLPDRATVETNRMFKEAVTELLTNAIKHNDAETPQVTVEVTPENGPSHMMEIRIVDNGPGIPESELEPLEAGEEEDLHHLSGVGLWFVEWTIRHSGGEFTVEDTEHAGATVVIHVPKAPEMLSSSLSSFLK